LSSLDPREWERAPYFNVFSQNFPIILVSPSLVYLSLSSLGNTDQILIKTPRGLRDLAKRKENNITLLPENGSRNYRERVLSSRMPSSQEMLMEPVSKLSERFRGWGEDVY
jgi:hypothetical protein